MVLNPQFGAAFVLKIVLMLTDPWPPESKSAAPTPTMDQFKSCKRVTIFSLPPPLSTDVVKLSTKNSPTTQGLVGGVRRSTPCFLSGVCIELACCRMRFASLNSLALKLVLSVAVKAVPLTNGICSS